MRKSKKSILIPPQETVTVRLPHGGQVVSTNASFLPAWIRVEQSEAAAKKAQRFKVGGTD